MLINRQRVQVLPSLLSHLSQCSLAQQARFFHLALSQLDKVRANPLCFVFRSYQRTRVADRLQQRGASTVLCVCQERRRSTLLSALGDRLSARNARRRCSSHRISSLFCADAISFAQFKDVPSAGLSKVRYEALLLVSAPPPSGVKPVGVVDKPTFRYTAAQVSTQSNKGIAAAI